MKKKVFVWIVFVLLLLHFVMVAKYIVAPDFLSKLYVDPFFHQSWSLFVPPPKENFRIIYHIKDDIKARDLLGEINSEHQQYRLAGNEAPLIAFTNAMHYCFAENPIATSTINEAGGRSANVLLSMVQGHLKLKNTELDSLSPVWLIAESDTAPARVLKLNFQRKN